MWYLCRKHETPNADVVCLSAHKNRKLKVSGLYPTICVHTNTHTFIKIIHKRCPFSKWTHASVRLELTVSAACTWAMDLINFHSPTNSCANGWSSETEGLPLVSYVIINVCLLEYTVTWYKVFHAVLQSKEFHCTIMLLSKGLKVRNDVLFIIKNSCVSCFS